MVKNAIIAIICMIAVVTAGSFAYVGYHNTKAHIRAENEKRKAEAPPPVEKPSKKEKKSTAEKEKTAGRVQPEGEYEEDIAHLVQDMYVTPSANGDISYQYEMNEEDDGVFLTPYVVEHKGASPTLHIIAGYRGSAPLQLDRIAIKGDQGDRVLSFQSGTMKQEERDGRVISCYDVPVASDMVDAMQSIGGAMNVKVTIVGHEQENKILSPAEIRRFKNILLLYDQLRD